MYEVDKNNAITMIKGDTVILDLKFFDQEDAKRRRSNSLCIEETIR